MQGFQVTFFTEEGRHHGRKQVHVWLMEVAKSLGITGITTAVAITLAVSTSGRSNSQVFVLVECPRYISSLSDRLSLGTSAAAIRALPAAITAR